MYAATDQAVLVIAAVVCEPVTIACLAAVELQGRADETCRSPVSHRQSDAHRTSNPFFLESVLVAESHSKNLDIWSQHRRPWKT